MAGIRRYFVVSVFLLIAPCEVGSGQEEFGKPLMRLEVVAETLEGKGRVAHRISASLFFLTARDSERITLLELTEE